MSLIQSFTFNPFQENTYIISDASGVCIIIDPGMSNRAEENEFSTFISDHHLLPVRLLNTHCHIDHVLGNDFCAKAYGLGLEIHPLDLPLLERGPQSALLFGVNYHPSPLPESFLAEGDVISFGTTSLTVLFVPGHAPGHVAFYCERDRFLISGDVLFQGSVGRVDFPGCNAEDLVHSIQQKLYSLPDDVAVYSGHGEPTQIGLEKINNSFVRWNSQNLI